MARPQTDIEAGREQLIDLAIRAGAESEGVSVQWEPEGVNLFLHVKVA